VDDIAAWLGWSIATFSPQDYPAGTYGFTDPDEDEQIIWLSRDLPETFRRFTLAHELGHAVLHCRGGAHVHSLFEQAEIQEQSQAAFLMAFPAPSRVDPCYADDIQENTHGSIEQERFEETLGPGHTYDPRSQRELAANTFAAELLMPLEQLRTRYLDQHIASQTLTARFGISQAALLNRLAGFMQTSPRVPASQEPVPQQSIDRSSPRQTNYDAYQQTAIVAPTPALIVAGPGSGKTSTLIGRIAYLVNTQDIAAQHVLALTFSRKAAQEMEERLAQVITAPLPRVSTFHAFCADTLRQHAALVGLRPDFTLVDEAEGYCILRQQTSGLRLKHYQKLQAPTYYFPDMLKAISRAKDELVTPADYEQLARRMRREAQDAEDQQQGEKALEIAQVYALYQQALQERGDTDFGGLLLLTVQLFQTHPEILADVQQRYQHILVDEFQDVNRASGVLLRELARASRNVWVVGDANQAIYGFRGASPANISQFSADFPGAVVLPLSRNYRSSPDLVTIAEAFRCTQLEPEQAPGKNQPTRPAPPHAIVTLAQATDEACELAGIVQDIRQKHAAGYQYKDMTVLCRTRSQAQKITRALAAANLPVIERSGMLEQAYIKNVLSILLLLSEESGMGLLRTTQQDEHRLSQRDIELVLLAAHQRQVKPLTLLFTGELPLAVSVEGHHALNRLASILQTLQRAPDTWTLLAQYLLVETTLVHDLLLAPSTRQRKAMLADYHHLLSLARHYDTQEQLRQRQQEHDANTPGEPPTLDVHIRGFLEYLSLLVLLRQDGGNRQSEEDDEDEQADTVQVMTVHASKGLEFPVVYLPGLSKRRFPSQNKANALVTPAGMLSAASEGNMAHETGESCLFYVGVTRAREHVILSHSERYGKQNYQRSPYLDALEGALPGERITKLVWEPATVPAATPQAEPLSAADPSAQMSRDFINTMRSDNLSANVLEAYQRCPRQYAYSYIYHFSAEADGYQLFWQTIRKTMEALQKKQAAAVGDQLQATLLPTQEETQELYTRIWQELGGDSAHFATLYEAHGHEVMEAERRRLSTQENTPAEMQQTFEVNVAGRSIRVPVDRVEAVQGEPVKFVRTRFGQRKEKPTPEMREYFYTLALRQHHSDQESEIHSHNLTTGEKVALKLTDKKEHSLQDAVVHCIEGIERNDYPARPAEPQRCPNCPFFLICPA
jgi:superfamily I DNA/RNA helicase/CRISPR/Cas system-associated exonuclease Cas4 (RecB family)